MRITASRAACLVASGMLATGVPSAMWAQRTATRKMGTISGAAEVGTRIFDTLPGSRELGKFLEYKDIKSGKTIEQMLLKYTPADSFGTYEIGGRKLLDTDRSLWMQASRPGLYDLQARYDGIPHTYSTTARSLLNEATPGVFTLPTPRPDSIAWRAAPYLAPVRNTWKASKVSLGVTPTPALESKAEYTRIDKTGSRPLSLSFAGSSGPTVEYPAPLDETIGNLKFTQSYATQRFQLTGSYAFSHYQTQNRFAEIASPLNATDTPTNGAAFSRVALPPENSAQTAVVNGGVNLPAHTRVMGSASVSWFRQNDVLVPQTSNALLASDPLLVLPRATLDGQAKTSNISLSASSRPVKNLRLAARFRSFDYSNQTTPFHINGMAVSDRSVSPADSFTSEAHPFTKSNSDFSVNYLLPASVSVTAGYAYETWTRDHEVRAIAKTTEGTPRVSLDFTGLDWVTFRGSYSKGTKRGDDYKDSTAAYDFPGFRAFDLGHRNRIRTALEASFTPLDEIDFSISWQDWKDKFPVAYGAQSDKSNMLGADINWSPDSRFSFGGGYSVEDISYIMKSRYKTGTRATPNTFDNPTWVWFSVDEGQSRTMYASFTAELIPRTLTGGGTFSSADSRFRDRNYNPVAPAFGTNAQNYAATAYNFPEVWSKRRPLALFLNYRYGTDWGVSLRYQLETFRQSDFRSLNPECYDSFTPAAPIPVDPNCTNSKYNIPPGADLSPSIGAFKFLGNNYRNYDAGWFTISFSYRPGALPFAVRRSAL